jgi:UDPglucose 6-dehydrogenase
MKIAVQGLWHLGSVTSACLASKNFKVLAVDTDKKLIENFNQGILPIFEPGLEDLFKKNKSKINFTDDLKKLTDIDLLWITFDTPVDNNDKADVKFVVEKIKESIAFLKDSAVVLISSQLPVESIKSLELFAKNKKRKISFAYCPENLRLGDALNVFLNPDRIVVGCRDEFTKKRISKILTKLTKNIVWMSVESAEMTKHAINSFLAISVTFANELASICEKVGADAKQVEEGLKTDIRIGKKAYLGPGGPFAGGTLARDIKFLENISKKFSLQNRIISSVFKSNQNHKQWHQKLILDEFGGKLNKKKFLILGLTYKANTNTLRRSQSLELISWLLPKNALISAYDPSVTLSNNKILKKIDLLIKVNDISMYDVIIIGTPLKTFVELFNFKILNKKVKNKIMIFDQHRLLDFPKSEKKIKYFTVGYVS